MNCSVMTMIKLFLNLDVPRYIDLVETVILHAKNTQQDRSPTTGWIHYSNQSPCLFGRELHNVFQGPDRRLTIVTLVCRVVLLLPYASLRAQNSLRPS